MELTGKCKEDFEKWYDTLDDYYHLELMPKNMLYGVREDYFDSVGIYVEMETRLFDHEHTVYICYKRKYTRVGRYKTRQEARDAAIEKANEIRNSYL